MAAPKLARHDFRPRDYVGGHPVVDLVNTVTARDCQPIDWLDDYDAIARWAAGSGWFAPTELPDTETARPATAAAELRRIKDLREAGYGILRAIATGRSVSDDAVERLQTHWRLAGSASRLDHTAVPLRVRHDTGGPAVTALRRTLAFHAVELLTSVDPTRLRICPGRHCGWLFLDTSKAGRRRWCDMATCGTAAKSRRRAARGTA